MVQCTFNIDAALLHEVDEAATERNVSRSRFIADCLHEWFAPKEPSSTEVNLLNKDIQRLNELMARQEIELNEAKDLNARLWLEWKECNDKLTRFLLPEVTETRRGFWSRVFRRRESRDKKANG